MRKLEIADSEIMRIAIQQEIARSGESRYDHRLHGLLLLTGGQSCQQIAELFGEDRRTVQRWVKRFEEHGLDGMRDGERLGRPACLDAKQWVALGRNLRAAPLISVMLDTCGTASFCPHTSHSATRSFWACVNASASSDRWAFVCASLGHSWLSLTRCWWRPLKKLHSLARRKDVDQWSLDECHFQHHGTPCRMWAPHEVKDPVLTHAPTRKSIACLGAVSLATEKFAYSSCDAFDSKTFATFLKLLLRHRTHGKRMVIVLDNTRYHS